LSASVSFLPLPHSHISVLALSPFSARAKHQKSRSLLPNPTETLATQANRIGQVANISNGTRPHVDARERIGDSSVRFQRFMRDQVKKLSSFGFKATFGV